MGLCTQLLQTDAQKDKLNPVAALWKFQSRVAHRQTVAHLDIDTYIFEYIESICCMLYWYVLNCIDGTLFSFFSNEISMIELEVPLWTPLNLVGAARWNAIVVSLAGDMKQACNASSAHLIWFKNVKKT